MCGCLFRGDNDFFSISIWIKARNVIGNRFIKQFLMIGQFDFNQIQLRIQCGLLRAASVDLVVDLRRAFAQLLNLFRQIGVAGMKQLLLSRF